MVETGRLVPHDADVAEDLVKAFVKWFRSELERRGMSQEEAARAFGVPLSSVSRWATGRTLPSYAHLVRIKKVWGVLPPPLA